MIGEHKVHGHAIVSDDDKIAGRDGLTPAALRSPADWWRFQQALDRAELIVLGRKGHALNPNPRGRNRLILSGSVADLERRADGLWWNPAGISAAEALAAAAPRKGIAAVVGGRLVYDLFLTLGYDEFHLVRARGVQLPGGIPVFSECTAERKAEDVLRARGLAPAQPEALDVGVTLTVWKPR